MLPRELWKTPSYRAEHSEILTDPDIFLNKASIENFDGEVIEAIGDAILCFKHGLYRPTVTMLGKAMEGAWIELGCSIANAALEGDNKEKERIIQKLQDDFVSVPAKIRQVSDLAYILLTVYWEDFNCPRFFWGPSFRLITAVISTFWARAFRVFLIISGPVISTSTRGLPQCWHRRVIWKPWDGLST
ncbi:hypothetical protein ACFLTV_01255 [Chloroflexota bacterium]